jgi:short-subunit dehydrogenase
MSPPGPRKVVIITGASQGIGAGLVAGSRASGYAVVGTSRSIPSSEALLSRTERTVDGRPGELTRVLPGREPARHGATS